MKSDRAGTPESPYYIRRTNNNKLVGGCFVLRPTKEPEALLTLQHFLNLLPDDDPRKESLTEWVDQLQELWKKTPEWIQLSGGTPITGDNE